jgi:hypothetical protein
MSLACQKPYQLTVASVTCPTPTLKSWTNAAVTGQTFDISAHSAFDNPSNCLVVTSTGLAWVFGPMHSNPFFVETYNTATPGVVTHGNAWNNGVGVNQDTVNGVYSTSLDTVVAVRQHWNGASNDIWVAFVNGTTGVEVGHIASGLFVSFNTFFDLVLGNGNNGTEVGMLGTNRLFHIDVVGQAILNSFVIAANTSGLCYSCITDSFFINHFTGGLRTDLLEIDRATMTLKNTYVGVGTNGVINYVDYIKTTQELWVYISSGAAAPANIIIIDPKTGVVKATIATPEAMPAWATNFGYPPRLYNPALNAFCFPSPNPGFSGNPYFYYMYDVVSRNLKKQLDITAQFQAVGQDWWGQGFNPTDGSCYLMGGAFNNTTNKGILVIGAS